jgi:sugar phosphate isomerase/epimerase
MVDIGAFRFGVATASLGMAASHTLELKLAALQKSGFTCCELGFGEYVAWVRRQCPDLSVTGASLGYNRLMVTGSPPSTCPPEWCEGDEPDPSDGKIWEAMNAQAPRLTALAESFGLTVMALQPLNQFDGWPEGCERAVWVRRKAERWLPLCAQLGVNLLQVCDWLSVDFC